MRTHGRYIGYTQCSRQLAPKSLHKQLGLTHSLEFPLFLGKKKMKSLLPLPKEGHTFSCTPKISKTIPKTRLGLSKRQQSPLRNHLPPAVPAKRQLPFRLEMGWLQRWQAAETAAAYSYRLRPLARPYPNAHNKILGFPCSQ